MLVLLVLLLAAPTAAQEPPSVSADAGPCWADFKVTDTADKPVYNAKIKVLVRHGFGGMRKTQVEVGTDAEGRARVSGLPEKSKKALVFEVSYGELQAKLEHNPMANCHAVFPVQLKPPAK